MSADIKLPPLPDIAPTDDWNSVLECVKAYGNAAFLAGAAHPAPQAAQGEHNRIAAALHYPDHWDTAAYPTLECALVEVTQDYACTECAKPAQGVTDEDVVQIFTDVCSNDDYERTFIDVSRDEAIQIGRRITTRMLSGQARAALSTPQMEVVAPDGFYLQDSRNYVGNCPMWWKEGGGYTTNVDKAERWTADRAKIQHQCRETDVPWPCAHVDALRRATVDFQDLGSIPKQIDAFRVAIAAMGKGGEQS